MTEQQRQPTQAPSPPVQSRSASSAVTATFALDNSALDCPQDTSTGLLHDHPQSFYWSTGLPALVQGPREQRNMHS